MPIRDTCCTLVPYFLVAPTQLDAFKSLCEQFVEKTRVVLHSGNDHEVIKDAL